MELYHHGIKGQKWGVKKGPPYPLDYADHSTAEIRAGWTSSLAKNSPSHPSALARIATNSMDAGRLVLAKNYTNKSAGNAGTKNKASSKTTGPLKERVTSPFKKSGIMAQNGVDTKDINTFHLGTLRSLNDKGITIEKGKLVQHVMSTPTKDMSNRDYLFVAATDADKKNYAGFFAALTKYRNDADMMYKMEMTAMTDLVSPSKKERVNTFIEIYKEDPIKVGRQLAEFNKRNYADQYKETTDQLAKRYANMSMRELKKMGYYTYANSWFDQEAGTLADMRAKLEKRGYNAIIDDNDKRSFIQSQAPLIVFNAQQNLGNIKISELTTREINQNMVDWQSMKHAEEEMDVLYH